MSGVYGDDEYYEDEYELKTRRTAGVVPFYFEASKFPKGGGFWSHSQALADQKLKMKFIKMFRTIASLQENSESTGLLKLLGNPSNAHLRSNHLSAAFAGIKLAKSCGRKLGEQRQMQECRRIYSLASKPGNQFPSTFNILRRVDHEIDLNLISSENQQQDSDFIHHHSYHRTPSSALEGTEGTGCGCPVLFNFYDREYAEHRQQLYGLCRVRKFFAQDYFSNLALDRCSEKKVSGYFRALLHHLWSHYIYFHPLSMLTNSLSDITTCIASEISETDKARIRVMLQNEVETILAWNFQKELPVGIGEDHFVGIDLQKSMLAANAIFKYAELMIPGFRKPRYQAYFMLYKEAEPLRNIEAFLLAADLVTAGHILYNRAPIDADLLRGRFELIKKVVRKKQIILVRDIAIADVPVKKRNGVIRRLNQIWDSHCERVSEYDELLRYLDRFNSRYSGIRNNPLFPTSCLSKEQCYKNQKYEEERVSE